jgi:hypothetical protein
MAERARSLARSLAQAMLEADREWSEITGSDNIANARQYEETERLFLNNFRVELSTKRRTARWLTQIRMSVK